MERPAVGRKRGGRVRIAERVEVELGSSTTMRRLNLPRHPKHGLLLLLRRHY
jgi:hypothetical protein